MSETSLALPTTSGSPRYALSFRALVILALATYLIVYPVLRSADIVASVLAFSLCAFILLIISATFLISVRVRRRLTVRVNILEHTGGIVAAQRPVTLDLTVSPVHVPPLISLQLMPAFTQGTIPIAPSIVLGSSSEERHIRQRISFPHRGQWTLSLTTSQLSDSFGLFSAGWNIAPGNCDFVVRPAEVAIAALPLISSSYRPGEISLEQSERLGDPFDLKPYHPSDGLKRILWKLYAKSGELISRHPERSVTPEGHTVIFCLARREEDYVAAASVDYCRRLDEAEISISFGCEGMPANGNGRTPAEAESLLIESVWNLGETLELDKAQAALHALINTFRTQHPHASLSKLIIFCSVERIQSHSIVQGLSDLGSYLEAQGCAPVFIMINRNTPPQLRVASGSSRRARLRAALDAVAPYFLTRPEKRLTSETNYYQQFLARCGSKQWQLMSFSI